MAIQIKSIKPLIGGEIVGVDLRGPLSDDDIAAIHAGMDKYAVLVFHGQQMDNEEHLAFTKRLGPLQPNVDTNVTKVGDRRLSVDFSDVSNIGKNQEILDRDSRRRLFSLGNRLWHSDASYRAVPAKYSMLYGHVVPPTGGNTEFAHMGAAYDALDDETKAEVEDLICEHSLLYSRALIGFTEYSEDELPKFKPVQQRLVRHHATMDRKSLYLAAHVGGIIGWPRPEAMAFIRDAAGIRLFPQMAAGRFGHLGQSPDHAPGAPLRRSEAQARYAPHNDRMRWADGGAAGCLRNLAVSRWR
jgi:alpha-ketoglutarate-dependent 2,4-dichlorophenoxyacetate dioxygenase